MAVNEDLTGFIREALGRGVSREEIHGALRAADWSDEEVQAALLAYADVDFPIPVPRPRPSLSAREAFEYLVLFGTLYLSAWSLGALLFQLIDLAMPDPSWPEARLDMIRDLLRWSIATLVVAAPIFAYATRANMREVARSPLKRTSTVRRWVTYLTLAIAAGVIIGAAITLVYDLLDGRATGRFILKILVLGGIAGTVFAYYLNDLRKDEEELAAQEPPTDPRAADETKAE